MPTISIDKLRRDSANRNRSSGRGRRAVKDSLETFGAGRSILLDRNNVCIAGNQALNAALELGFDDVLVVEATGKQLVAVKRTDLDLTEKNGRARALSISDNRCSELGWSPDLQLLAEDLRSGLTLPDSILTADEVSAMLAKSVEQAAAMAQDLERGEVFGGGIPRAEGAFLDGYLTAEGQSAGSHENAEGAPGEDAKVMFVFTLGERDRLFALLNRVKAQEGHDTHARALLAVLGLLQVDDVSAL
jgi:hypothetical protein